MDVCACKISPLFTVHPTNTSKTFLRTNSISTISLQNVLCSTLWNFINLAFKTLYSMSLTFSFSVLFYYPLRGAHLPVKPHFSLPFIHPYLAIFTSFLHLEFSPNSVFLLEALNHIQQYIWRRGFTQPNTVFSKHPTTVALPLALPSIPVICWYTINCFKLVT